MLFENIMDNSHIALISSRIEENFGISSDGSDSKWSTLQELHTFLKEVSNKNSVAINYCNILNILLDALKPNIFTENWQENLFDEVVLMTFYHDTFLVLTKHLTKSEPSYHQTKVVKLIEKFIQQNKMQNLFMDQCCSDDPLQLKYVSSSGLWNELITNIISLPDKIANKTKGNLGKIFIPMCYVSIIQITIYKVLNEIHKQLIHCKDCNIEFLSKIVGRLCNTGHGFIFVKTFTLKLIKNCSTDFVWRRIAQNLISKIPSSCLEMFLVHFLISVPWYRHLEWLLSDAILSQSKIKYLLTVKFLFVRQFKDSIILQNILGYLTCSESKIEMFSNVFASLLEIWADSCALKHQNYEQQYYLCSSLIICCAYLKTQKMNFEMQKWLGKALDGSTIRIGSSVVTTRYLGMITGECLTSVLDPNAPKLTFDEEFPLDILKLKDLLIIPSEPDVNIINEEIDINNLFVENKKLKEKSHDKINISGDNSAGDDNSDDDLEPYDMSNIPCSVKRPFYIRDCLEGLIESNQPEWTEQCLRCAESLISSCDDIKEIAQEMIKVLLHLDNSFGMSDFVECRFKAMVALAVKCPIQVAEYLSSQFYERDYNIRQRLDILEVLGLASCELSQPKSRELVLKPEVSVSSSHNEALKKDTLQEIVKQRIEAKTKRFSKGPQRLAPEPEINIFGTVAGYFFFPLMEKFDKRSKMLDLCGDDSFVLGRLLYALGVIMHSASNTLVVKPMGLKLLQFVLATKGSEDTFVRQSAIFAIMSVYLSVPSFILLSELQEEVFNCRIWLEEIKTRDSDVDCQIQATKTIELLMNVIQEELPSMLEEMRND